MFGYFQHIQLWKEIIFRYFKLPIKQLYLPTSFRKIFQSLNEKRLGYYLIRSDLLRLL